MSLLCVMGYTFFSSSCFRGFLTRAHIFPLLFPPFFLPSHPILYSFLTSTLTFLPLDDCHFERTVLSNIVDLLDFSGRPVYVPETVRVLLNRHFSGYFSILYMCIQVPYHNP